MAETPFPDATDVLAVAPLIGVTIKQTEVTFDRAKDADNVKKRGISLQRAEDFDADTALFEVDNSQDYGEERWNAIGWFDAMLYFLTFTLHGEIVHAISIRKTTAQERKQYAQN